MGCEVGLRSWASSGCSLGFPGFPWFDLVSHGESGWQTRLERLGKAQIPSGSLGYVNMVRPPTLVGRERGIKREHGL